MRRLLLLLWIGIAAMASCTHKPCCEHEPTVPGSVQIPDSLLVPSYTAGDPFESFIIHKSMAHQGPATFIITFSDHSPIIDMPSVYFSFESRPVKSGIYKTAPFPQVNAPDEVLVAFTYPNGNNSSVYSTRWKSFTHPENKVSVYVKSDGKLHIVCHSLRMWDQGIRDTSSIFFNLTEI